MNKTATKTKKIYIEKNPLEQIGQAGDDVISQLLGHGEYKTDQDLREAGDLIEGEELIFKNFQKKNARGIEGIEDIERKLPQIEAAIDYSREVIHVGEGVTQRENQEIEVQLKEVMVEIKKLTDSSKELQVQFKEVAVGQHVANPGDYHKSFFSWLLSVVRAARMNIEDSGTWLNAINCKKKMKNYATMAKKHGTSFTLNNERTVATQTG